MNRRLAIVCIVGFSTMFLIAFLGSWAASDYNDRLYKMANEKAKEWSYMGFLIDERVFFNEKEMKIEYKK